MEGESEGSEAVKAYHFSFSRNGWVGALNDNLETNLSSCDAGVVCISVHVCETTGTKEHSGRCDLHAIPGAANCGGSSCTNAWPDAVAQTVLSLSVTFGVMTAYASYNPRNQGVMVDATATMLGDFLASFFGGFASFAALGVYAHGTSTPIAEAVSEYPGGVSLVTIWVPSAIDELGSALWEASLQGRKFSLVAMIHNADPPRH